MDWHIVGEMIGSLCKQLGPGVYENCKETILSAIQSEMKYNPNTNTDDAETNIANGYNNFAGMPKMETDQNDISGAFKSEDAPGSSFEKMTVFDAAPRGVRSSKLETLLKCVMHVISALRNDFKPYISQDFLETVLATLQHHNRFVREVGFNLCSTLLEAGMFHREYFC